jgi:hypothetical protein
MSTKNVSDVVITKISDVLEEILEQFKNEKEGSEAEKVFRGRKLPKISLKDYISRLVKHIKPEISSFYLSFIYLDRFSEMTGIKLKNENIHRLYFIALVLAVKYNEDLVFSNELFAGIGGLPLKELNKMESEFLSLTEFTVFVQEDVYNEYVRYLNRIDSNK